MPGERWKSREQKAGSAALLPDFARLKSRAKIRENPGEAGKSREKPGRRAADQNPGLPANSVAYFVTYVRPVLNFPREGGQIAKKWSENDPLVVGGGGGGKLI